MVHMTWGGTLMLELGKLFPFLAFSGGGGGKFSSPPPPRVQFPFEHSTARYREVYDLH